MEYLADLHIHSRHARACSDQLTLENMDATASEKGITLLGTGDFTHPLWLNSIKSSLSGDNGIYSLKNSKNGTKFVLSSEVCTIFEDKSQKSRRIHHCMLAPSTSVAEQINNQLSAYGDLSSDGRPILNLPPDRLVKIVSGISKDVFIYPAHIWTPWYGVLGAFSGFNSIKDAYGDQAVHIHAIEMGLSSDLLMNWRVSRLDEYTLLAGSDAHSLPKIGREAIIIDGNELSYGMLIDALKANRIKKIIKFYPEAGKYHYDGHRNCGISLAPEQAAKYNGMCPKCGKRLTKGVLHRVDELADRTSGYVPNGAVPYVHSVQLLEIIAYVMKKSPYSPHVKRAYSDMISKFGPEFDILLNVDIDRIKHEKADIGAAIERIRSNKIRLIPGYDGVFGTIDIFNEAEQKTCGGMQKRIS